MKFEPGDKIAIKATKEEGVFIKEIDKKMVLISINNTEFPVFAVEIEHPYFNWFTDKTFKTSKASKVFIDNIPKEKQIAINNLGMHLVFVPSYKNIIDDDVIDKVKVYLSNNQATGYSFHYAFSSKDGENFNIQSEVAMQSDFYLHDISYEHLATNPLFDISCAEIISNITSSIFQYQDQFSIKPKKLFAWIQDMHLKNVPFFSLGLFNISAQINTFNQNIVVTPWQPKSASNFDKKPKLEPSATEKVILPVPAPKFTLPEIKIEHYFTNPFEIDLHIDKLLFDAEKMSADEKINFQIAIFTKTLDTAILRGQNSLVVIHGIGKGVLKNKIHGILNQTKQVHSYVNQFDKRFGFGATEIFFVQ